MKFMVECSLADFNAWAGGKATLDDLRRHQEAYDYIESFINEWTYGNNVTDTDVNDFLWFEVYDMLAEAGLYDNENDVWLNEGEEK